MNKKILLFGFLTLALTLGACSLMPQVNKSNNDNSKQEDNTASFSKSSSSEIQHIYSDQWSFNDDFHWHACTDKGYEHLKKDQAKHDFECITTPATYETGSVEVYTCKICSYSFLKLQEN